MSEQSALSSEELDFLRQLFSSQLIGKPLHIPSFKVDGGALANALLSRLGQHAQLNLEARMGNYRMSFPLQLVEDEMHSLQLEMGAPSIYEEGVIRRPWRLVLAKPLPLREQDGAASSLLVHEIAPDSLLIGPRGKTALPEEFSLWLPLPGQEAIPVYARRIRQSSGQRAAYSLLFSHNEHTERIRQFIFEQYRQQNPQLQAVS
jgi:hypothetical protein